MATLSRNGHFGHSVTTGRANMYFWVNIVIPDVTSSITAYYASMTWTSMKPAVFLVFLFKQ